MNHENTKERKGEKEIGQSIFTLFDFSLFRVFVIRLSSSWRLHLLSTEG
jgi:hypothetical protein